MTWGTIGAAAAPAASAGITAPSNPWDFSSAAGINNIYNQFLGRDADTDGLQYWANQANSGISGSDLQARFLTGANQELMNRPQQAVASAPVAPQNNGIQQLIAGLTAQSNDNLMNTVLPQVNWGSSAAGGFGDSRNGLASGRAIGLAQQGLDTNIGNILNSDYQAQQNRDLQRYGIDSNYSLGVGGLYNQSRGLDLQQLGLGASLYGQGNQGYLGIGSGLTGIGDTLQNAPWSTLNNFTNTLGSTQGNTSQVGTSQGNPYLTGLGAAGLANSYINKYGQSSNPGTSSYATWTGTEPYAGYNSFVGL